MCMILIPTGKQWKIGFAVIFKYTWSGLQKIVIVPEALDAVSLEKIRKFANKFLNIWNVIDKD